MPQQIRSIHDWTKHPDEKLRFTFDFSPNLLSGRKIASVEAITIGSDDEALTVTSLGVSTTVIDDDEGGTIPIGTAVLVRVEGGTSGRQYDLLCHVKDDNPTEGQEDELVLLVPLHIKSA